MPRKGPISKREILPDPIYNSRLVARFVNRLMYDGKKGPAETIFYRSLEILGEKTGEEALTAFEKAVPQRPQMPPIIRLSIISKAKCLSFFKLCLLSNFLYIFK